MENKLAIINEGLTYYVIEPVSKCMQEDGNFQSNKDGTICGYGVRNKATGIVEHSTVMLPVAIFQADYLDKSLVSLFDSPAIEVDVEGGSTDDVILPDEPVIN